MNVLLKGRRVFISHASVDAPFAAWLDSELRAAGFETWLDAHEVRVGYRLTRTLGQAIDDAMAAIVVISAASQHAKWMWLELGQAQHRMVTDDRFKVLPALIEDAPVPPELRDIVFADFRASPADGLAKIVAALRDLARDDWFYRYRSRTQAVRDAVSGVFGSIGSASILDSYHSPDLDFVEFTFETDEPDTVEAYQAAIEVDPGEVSTTWLAGLSDALNLYNVAAALIVTDETPPTDLFQTQSEGVFVCADDRFRFAHIVLMDETVSSEVARSRLRQARVAMEQYLKSG